MTEESTTPFLNLAELQKAHERLWDERPEGALPAGWRERVTELLDRGVATGTLLSDRRERQAAQQILNSWVAHLTDPEGDTPAESQSLGAAEADKLPRPEVAPVPVRVLARYDESTTNRVGERLNDWVEAVPQPEMRRAREVLQQLVRLRPDTTDKFDSSPVLRATLYDLASAAEIDATLEQLAGLGVVAMERGDTPENDRFRLAHPELLVAYPQLDLAWRTLRRWLDERVQFRQQVLQWHAAGRDRKQLVSGELGLDFARVYHDRNMLEREFIAESFGDEKRRSERERRKQEGQRRQLLMATVLIPVLTILSVWALRERARSQRAEQAATDAATQARRAEKEAKEAATRAQQAADAEKKANTRANELATQISDRSDLRRMLQILRALSEIGAARSRADLDVGLLQLRSILEQKDLRAESLLNIQQSLAKAFRKPPADGLSMAELMSAFEHEADDCWRKSLLETAPSSDKRLRQYEESRIWKLFRRRLLNVAHAFRNSWLADENPAAPAETPPSFRQEALQQIRLETYTRIGACVDALQAGLENGSYNDAAPFVREFWLNYWGEMGMFEGEEVMRAMVEVGETLRGIEADLLQTVDVADPTIQAAPAPRLIPKQERVEIDKEIRWSRLNRQAPENRRTSLKTAGDVLKVALWNEIEPPQRIGRYRISE